jgi:hypothetical protein
MMTRKEETAPPERFIQKMNPSAAKFFRFVIF